MIDPKRNGAEGKCYVNHREFGEGVGGGLRSSQGRTSLHPSVATSKPRTREEVLRLWLALLVVCLLGAVFYYGLARLLIALGIFKS